MKCTAGYSTTKAQLTATVSNLRMFHLFDRQATNEIVKN